MRQAQTLLARFGYDPGPADGLIGKDTVTAIKAFQTAEGQTVTGYPNPQFYADLYRKAGIENDRSAYIYVRQDAKNIYSAAISLRDPDAPLGAHLFVLTNFDAAAGEANWNSTTVRNGSEVTSKRRKKVDQPPITTVPMTAGKVLNRIILPAHVTRRIEDLLTPESSMIIADGGHTRETGQDTDFIVVTK